MKEFPKDVFALRHVRGGDFPKALLSGVPEVKDLIHSLPGTANNTWPSSVNKYSSTVYQVSSRVLEMRGNIDKPASLTCALPKVCWGKKLTLISALCISKASHEGATGANNQQP